MVLPPYCQMDNLNSFRPQTASHQDIILISICLIQIEIVDFKLHAGHEYKHFFQGAWIFNNY